MRPLGRTSSRTVTTGERTRSSKGTAGSPRRKKAFPVFGPGVLFPRREEGRACPWSPGREGVMVGPLKRQRDVGTAAPPASHQPAELKVHRTQAATPRRTNRPGATSRGSPRGAALRRGNAQPGGLQGRTLHQLPRCHWPPLFPGGGAAPWPWQPREGGSMKSLNPTSHRGLLPRRDRH